MGHAWSTKLLLPFVTRLFYRFPRSAHLYCLPFPERSYHDPCYRMNFRLALRRSERILEMALLSITLCIADDGQVGPTR